MSTLGRISGKLLSANLQRNGTNLTFRNTVSDPAILHLDVNNMRIGIVSDTPEYDLDVNSTTRTTDLIVNGTDAKISNVVINTNGTISTLVGALNIRPTGVDPIINHERLITDSLDFNDNYIAGLVPNTNFELRPNGIGKTMLNADTRVYGSVDVTQNIFANSDVNVRGIVTVGDSPFDTVTVNTDFTQSIIPGTNYTYDLGTTAKRWRRVYIQDNDPIDGLFSSVATIGNNIRISTNQIITTQVDSNLFLSPSTGITVLDSSITIQSNIITNLSTNPLTFASTGNGYLEFAGSVGVLIPAGTIAERQGNEVGDTRWNTETSLLESFDGTVWQVSTGGGETVTQSIMEDLGHAYTLIFG